MKEKKGILKPPFYTENETIHRDGHTQVQLWLNDEQISGLKALEVTEENYSVILIIALNEYLENHE